MRSTLAPVAALLLSVAILLTGNGLQGTLLPIRAQMEQFSVLSIGILGSSYFLGFGAGCLLGPRLVQRVGHIRTFTAMAAIASAVPLAHALALLPLAWWPMRATTGFCFAVLYIVIESWLNERSTNETRGAVLSVYLVINLTVLTLGQLLVMTADPATFPLFALAAILVSLAAVPVALTTASAPAPVESVEVHLPRLFRASPVGFCGCLAIGLSNGAFWALAPVYGTGVGLDVAGIALFMSAAVLGGAVGQWPIGRISDLEDRRKVLAKASAGAVAAGLVLAFASGERTVLVFACAAVWGYYSFPLYAIAIAHTNDFADPGDYVQVSSGLLLVYAGGAVAGPVVATAFLGVLDAPGLFAFTAVVHAGIGAFALWRMSRRAPSPPADHVAFEEALQSAYVVSPAFDPVAAHADEAEGRETA